MGKQTKTYDIKIIQKRPNGGRIRINTASVDRDKDRVFPSGAKIQNYNTNPTVQWGHNYRDPWAVVGKTNELIVTDDYIDADFDLRPAANDQDPQNVVLLLWAGDWVRTASIGFMPDRDKTERNDQGGFDYKEWELIEWSLVPIPSNQDALRQNWIKAFGAMEPEVKGEGDDLAWIRILEVESDLGIQKMFAAFRSYSTDIPEDATKLDFDEDGDLIEVPHPDAGKTIWRKEVDFIPPIAYTSDKWGEDATYSVSARDIPDEELVKSKRESWKILELSEIVLSLPVEKSWNPKKIFTLDVCELTDRGVTRLKQIFPAIKQRQLTKDNKTVVPYRDEGTADEGESWSRPTLSDFTDQTFEELTAAERRRIMRHYAWSANNPPEAFGDLKLPHHKPQTNGVGPAVWRGVAAAAQRISSSDIPEADVSGVRAHLAAHYRQYDKPVPWEQESMDDNNDGANSKIRISGLCYVCGKDFDFSGVTPVHIVANEKGIAHPECVEKQGSDPDNSAAPPDNSSEPPTSPPDEVYPPTPDASEDELEAQAAQVLADFAALFHIE